MNGGSYSDVSTGDAGYNFYASKANSLYKDSAVVQPKARGMCVWRRTA